MPLVNNTNVSSLLAQRTLGDHTRQVERSMERLSSGLRINRSADDAAGLAISENMEGQQLRMKQALRNAQDGVSLLQVAEGAITTIGDILQRVRELTVQAANDTNSTQSRDAIEQEVKALLSDADRIAEATEFNGMPLLNNAAGFYAPIQIGPNSTAQTNVMDVGAALLNVHSGDPNYPGPGLGIFGGGTTFADIASIDFTSNAISQSFLGDIDQAIDKVISQRATMGSFQNQLESITNNLEIGIENFGAAVSRIRDLDVASESSVLVQNQILQQAAVSILAQSNNLPQMILGLLKD